MSRKAGKWQTVTDPSGNSSVPPWSEHFWSTERFGCVVKPHLIIWCSTPDSTSWIHTHTLLSLRATTLQTCRLPCWLEKTCGGAKLIKVWSRGSQSQGCDERSGPVISLGSHSNRLPLLPKWNSFWRLNLSSGRSRSPLINEMLSLSLRVSNRVL